VLPWIILSRVSSTAFGRGRMRCFAILIQALWGQTRSWTSFTSRTRLSTSFLRQWVPMPSRQSASSLGPITWRAPSTTGTSPTNGSGAFQLNG
jgi:hypothetical protein